MVLAQPAPTEIDPWIKANAIPLSTVQAGHGFADMQLLKLIIGDARMVSLGEATHGTREFFQLKHRMVEFLATGMGFTIFSIEANMPEAYRLNDYVLNGKGNAAELLKGMYFWTWNTKEVLEMIEWMRASNESGKDESSSPASISGLPTLRPGSCASLQASTTPVLPLPAAPTPHPTSPSGFPKVGQSRPRAKIHRCTISS
jgi:erythromycin esterase-like protein